MIEILHAMIGVMLLTFGRRLFWLFVENYHQKIAQNPRLGVMVAAIDRMDDPTREGHFSTAQAYLQELHGSMG